MIPTPIDRPASEIPWCVCEVDFAVDDMDALWHGFERVAHRIPAGWTLVRTHTAFPRPTAVFRVDDLPRARDRDAVLHALAACGAVPADGLPPPPTPGSEDVVARLDALLAELRASLAPNDAIELDDEPPSLDSLANDLAFLHDVIENVDDIYDGREVVRRESLALAGQLLLVALHAGLGSEDDASASDRPGT